MEKWSDKTIMEQWDYWRGEIACGNTSSGPRDWFESIIDMYEEKQDELCKIINVLLKERIAELEKRPTIHLFPDEDDIYGD